MKDPWAERDCDQCGDPFVPDRRGQKICQRCKDQERDAEERKRGRWD